ncbi:hypothetical protein HOT81_gp116 [Gordonia phage Fryberger]|uniref:Uncharacterized protein n=2 Tax=Ronaldovirus TaxID=2733205 RepID=A0A6B9LEP7_9CAUD|nr:hypothetical protein HOT81_gp116 [Gordonia phage Fryberger]AXN53563.1 hypothetical protein SEA_FRYBERGER_116 [Gordonia phage Fryberger]QHB38268.1 hypothetical protein SEA_VOLT_120 [Gordonia phage Volt]
MWSKGIRERSPSTRFWSSPNGQSTCYACHIRGTKEFPYSQVNMTTLGRHFKDEQCQRVSNSTYLVPPSRGGVKNSEHN